MRKLPLLLGLVALALVVYAFLPKRPEPTPPAPPTATDYVWANALKLPSPPAEAFREEVLRDPVERALSRLSWGPPEIAIWTQSNLPDDRTRLARRISEELEKVSSGASLGAARLLETLGVLGVPAGVPTLLSFASHEPDYLQLPAIKALSHCPWTEEVEETLSVLTRSPNGPVRSAAQRALLERPGFMDPATIEGFLLQYEGPDAHIMLEQVGLSGITELSDAVARHLDSSVLTTRQIAIRSLLRLEDPRGARELRVELEHELDQRVFYALTIYRDVGRTPPRERLIELLAHPMGDLRKEIVETLGPRPDQSPEERETCLHVLQRLAEDVDDIVRRAAVHKLSTHGRHEQLQPWRDRLRVAHGDELKMVVKMLCEGVGDEAVAPILRQRLDSGEENPNDSAHLLFGLRYVGNADDAPRYLERMLRGGSSEDRRGGTQATYLSEHASLYVQSLGPELAPALVEALPRASNDRASFLVLDALRGVVTGPSLEVETALFELIRDPAASSAVRFAAADSLVHLRNPQLFDPILALSREVEDRALGQRLLRICVCYF